MNLFTDLAAGAQVARAVRALDGRADGTVLGYHPVARMNPFQALLYGGAYEAGFSPVALIHREDLGALEVARKMGVKAMLHLHWTSEILAASADESDAKRRAEEFLEDVSRLGQQGIKIVWTVHNVLPHRCPYPDIEATLRQGIADRADAIHIMTSDTPAQTSKHYQLPADRLIHVPHPSYLGAYSQHFPPRLARYELGYEPSDILVGVVGSIQPYKGIDRFIEAVESLSTTQPALRAIVAGLPGRDTQSSILLTELNRSTAVRAFARKLDPSEISLLMTALDAAVLPYRASLNSGAALLSLTFGVPIIAPLFGHFRTLIDTGLGLGYPPSHPDGLAECLSALPDFLKTFDRSRAISYAEEVSGPRVSRQLFDSLGTL